VKPGLRLSDSKVRKRDTGIWQRRYWEHTNRDQSDFDAHVEYCHFNRVKHGFVEQPEDRLYSSVHRVLVG